MRTKLLALAETWRIRILLGLVVAVPVVFLRVVSDPINVPKLTVLFIGVAAAGALRGVEIAQGASWRGLTRVVVPAAVVTFALSLAWVFSSFRGWALLGEYHRLQGLLPYVAVIAAGILIADGFAGRPNLLMRAVAIAGAITAGYACLQYLHLDPFSWSAYGSQIHSATSTLGNRDFTGGFLAISLPIAIGLCTIERARRWIAVAIAVLIVAGLAVTFSQGAWAAAVAGSALVLGHAVQDRWGWAPVLGAIGASLVAAAIVAIVVIAALRPNTDALPTTVRYRGDWAQEAIRMGNSSPLVGTGPNTFAVRGVHYRSAQDALDFGYGYTDDPHSVPLAMYANAGLVGLIAFFFLAGWTISRYARVTTVTAAAFMGGAAAYLVQSCVSIDEPSLRFAFWVSLGGLSAATAAIEKPRHQPQSSGRKRKRRPQPRREPVRNPIAIAVIGLAFLLVFLWSVSYVVADARFLQATNLLRTGRLDEAQHQYQLAVGLRPDPYYRQTYGTELGHLLVAAGKPAAPVFPRVRSAFGYLDGMPAEDGLIQYAAILHQWSEADSGALGESAALYRRAVALDPLNPEIRISLASVYLDMKENELAISTLPRLPSNTPHPARYSAAWGIRALAEARLGDDAAASEDAQQALSLFNHDKNAEQALELLQKRSH